MENISFPVTVFLGADEQSADATVLPSAKAINMNRNNSKAGQAALNLNQMTEAMVKMSKAIAAMDKKPKAQKKKRGPRKQQRLPTSDALSAPPVALGSRQAFGGGRKAKARSWRFTNREMVVSTSGTTSDTVPGIQTFAINPGLTGSFPWLSGETDRWEQYILHAVTYEWVPGQGSSGKGYVILSPEYDASEPAPTTLAQLTNTEDAVSDRVWNVVKCPLSPQAMHTHGPRKLIRNGMIAGDLNIYDVGKMNIAVYGNSDTDLAGQVWVSYDIELLVPQNSADTGSSPSYTSVFTNSGGDQAYATTVAENVDFVRSASFDPLGWGDPVLGVFTPPRGSYDIDVRLVARDTATEAFAIVGRFHKNGAVLSIPINCRNDNGTNIAAPDTPASMRGVVNFNGTDTFAVNVTLTGAAGTLTLQDDFCQLIIRPA